MKTPFNIEPEKIYTLNEIADILRISEQTVKKSVKTGKLAAYCVGDGRMYRVIGEDFIKFIHASFRGEKT